MSIQTAILGGRCANGFERDQGRVVHLVEYGSHRPMDYHMGAALCGAKPGARSVGWSVTNRTASCARCLKKQKEVSDVPPQQPQQE